MRRRVTQFTSGGRWTEQLSPPIRHNLRCFWLDGVLVSASDAIIASYVTLYVLALGASATQIGAMSALANLAAALLVLPGARLVDRWGRRKPVVLLGGKGVAKSTLFLLALVPFALSGQAAVYAAIGLSVIRVAFTYLGMPAWTSLSADIVPLSWRGRYFSARNIAMGVANMLTTYTAGQLITIIGGLSGYQIALTMAGVLGIGSFITYAHIHEPPAPVSPKPARRRVNLIELLAHARSLPGFLAFAVTAALLNFSLSLASPFFNVHLANNLGASAGIVGTLTVLSSLAALPGQRLFGSLVDRWGAYRVRVLTNFIVPIMPWLWILARSPWHTGPAQILGGFMWAGYNLANFNLLLEFTPEDQRTHYTALYQIALTLSTAGGAALGGVIAEHWSYSAIFFLSGAGRLIAGLLFIWLVRRPAEHATHTNTPTPTPTSSTT
ncbi:MAG: MFS transporter [Chloroflexi bacterium]|nr:MFS transporter [Chloroflexota bacterium]